MPGIGPSATPLRTLRGFRNYFENYHHDHDHTNAHDHDDYDHDHDRDDYFDIDAYVDFAGPW